MYINARPKPKTQIKTFNLRNIVHVQVYVKDVEILMDVLN